MTGTFYSSRAGIVVNKSKLMIFALILAITIFYQTRLMIGCWISFGLLCVFLAREQFYSERIQPLKRSNHQAMSYRSPELLASNLDNFNFSSSTKKWIVLLPTTSKFSAIQDNFDHGTKSRMKESKNQDRPSRKSRDLDEKQDIHPCYQRLQEFFNSIIETTKKESVSDLIIVLGIDNDDTFYMENNNRQEILEMLHLLRY